MRTQIWLFSVRSQDGLQHRPLASARQVWSLGMRDAWLEMFLSESLWTEAGLVQVFPWGTLHAEFKHLPQFCQAITSVQRFEGADGLLPDLKIPENRVKTLQSFPFHTYDSHAFASYVSFAFPPSWVIVLYLI